jgi:hypothetical protein
MNNSQIIGVIKGQTVANTIYRTIGGNVYNQNNILNNLSDVNITTPLSGQIVYFESPTYRNKFNTFQTGTSNINWSDMIGFSTSSLNTFSLTLTYNNATQKYVQYQRLHSSINANFLALNTVNLLTNNIFSISTRTPSSNNAFNSPSFSISNSPVSGTIMATYLTANSGSGITLTNGCYNRAFEVNGYLSLSLATFTDGASFIVYVYLGNTIIAQTSVVCRTGDTTKLILIYAVVNTTVANVGQNIDFKLQYTGSTLTAGSGGALFNFSVKSL